MSLSMKFILNEKDFSSDFENREEMKQKAVDAERDDC
jgi:hypothetical protein